MICYTLLKMKKENNINEANKPSENTLFDVIGTGASMQVKHETEKAYLVDLTLLNGCTRSKWIPKSIITVVNDRSVDHRPKYNLIENIFSVEIAYWWIKKEIY